MGSVLGPDAVMLQKCLCSCLHAHNLVFPDVAKELRTFTDGLCRDELHVHNSLVYIFAMCPCISEPQDSETRQCSCTTWTWQRCSKAEMMIEEELQPDAVKFLHVLPILC